MRMGTGSRACRLSGI
uniref:Uncharacterized protein n=1 Tax=Arundo donax TaxID=35708 RepID=A0A0A9APC4_ARUDO